MRNLKELKLSGMEMTSQEMKFITGGNGSGGTGSGNGDGKCSIRCHKGPHEGETLYGPDCERKTASDACEVAYESVGFATCSCP